MEEKSVSNIVLKAGKRFYKIGKYLMYGLLGFALLLLEALICLLGWGADSVLYLLILYTKMGFVDFLTVLSYIGIVVGLVGVALWFTGLNLMGLGQVAVNTDKE